MVVTFDIEKDKLDYDFTYNKEETTFLKKRFEDKLNLITTTDLLRVALWKINRVMEIDDGLLIELNKLRDVNDLKVTDALSIQIIDSLTKSKGVGLPMASAILKFLRPDVFPIIDVRAYRALTGKKIYSSQYTIQKYLDYAEKVFALSKKLKIPLSNVDEQLYKFDEEKNGKI